MPHLESGFEVDGQSPWNVTARDINLFEVEQANGYERLRMDLRDSNVGEWTLRIKRNHPAAPYLLQPGSGIVVRPIGHSGVVMSGFIEYMYITESANNEEDNLTFVGFTDEILLSELAFPDPSADVSTTGASTFAQTDDVRSGPAETALKGYVSANIGPAAGIVRRRYPFLNIPATAGLGALGIWKARFHNLLELCRQIAVYGNLSFRVAQSAPGEVTLYVWEPAQRLDVRFGVKANNLTSAVLTYRAPNMTEGVVGGGGEGAARIFARRTEGGESVLVLTDATDDYVSTPDHASLDIVGDLDIRAEVSVDNWDDLGSTSGGATLFSKWLESTNNRSYLFRVSETGFLRFNWSSDGTNNLSATSTNAVGLTPGRHALRVTIDVNNGASGRTITFYKSTSLDGSWTQIEQIVQAGVTSIDVGSALGTIGWFSGVGDAGYAAMMVHRVEVRSGIGGTVVADPDLRSLARDTTSFVDSAGRTWTLQGDAEISAPPAIEDWGRRVVRFLDQRNEDTVAGLWQAADTDLYEAAVTGGMTLYPIEYPGTLFGVDYDLGDIVAAVVDDIEIVQPVRRVVIEHEAGRPPDVVPSVGLMGEDGESPEDAPLIKSIIRNITTLMRR
jgi:hypothetical protein